MRAPQAQASPRQAAAALAKPCRRPLECAAQPADVHMWHHEDAGIGYNVFRAAVAHNFTLNYMAVPGTERPSLNP